MIMESEQNSKRKKPDNPEVIYLSLSRIILAILLTNAAGISLRYFDLDTYFIFLGFRFHLSAVFPFIILYKKDNLTLLFEALKKPRFKRKFVPLLWLIISLAVVLILLFLFKKIKSGNPDYFYEFGLSSVFDYPLYLVWNFPQLCLLYITLLIISRINKFNYLNASAGSILLFVYELIPFGMEFNPVEIIPLIAISLTACFFITRLESIYWFSVIIFSSVWSIVLLFGSGSAATINIFFAKEYSAWEGFFETAKGVSAYVIPLFFLIMFIIVLFYVIFNKSRLTEKQSF